MKKVFIIILVSCVCAIAHADTIWELRKDNDGIQVYTGENPNSNKKTVRVTCTVNARLSQLVALLLDMKAHEEWVYNTKTSYLVKQLSKNHLQYYSEISFPWPLINRDVVADLVITQQPDKVILVTATSIDNVLPKQPDIVRIPLSKVTWTITPVSSTQVNIEYIAEADPGGTVPAWLVNAFCTKGPFQTFKKLRELVATAPYANAKVDFIKD